MPEGPLPLVAIVGRPNVGKSTLFNRILGQRRAIVEDLPGTTRDRIYGEAEWGRTRFALVDTGGLLSDEEIAQASQRDIAEATRQQAELALQEADIILFVVDAQAGLTAGDWEIADLLRKANKPVLVVANKAEKRQRQFEAMEFAALGLGEPIIISAAHGQNIGELLERLTALVATLPHAVPAGEDSATTDAPHIAIVGRPNVGKSALLNAITGQPRQIVSPIPGTTRDAVDTPLTWKGQPIVLVDTAGIRRPGRIERGVERYSVLRAQRALARADVAILVVDASEPFTAQDQHIAGAVLEAKAGIVVAVNKWDLFEHMEGAEEAYRETAQNAFAFMPWAPIVFVSAVTGKNVEQVVDLALVVAAERSRRIPTAELNRLVQEAVHHHPPPSKPGKWVKIYYATQAETEPPTFVFFCRNAEGVHFSYKRYLENTIRRAYGFFGTPIELVFRERERSAPGGPEKARSAARRPTRSALRKT
ncbi:ribosome biogenesis GTPase Der [Thermorudis peleae]|uniref:ribosome biogenesis GTPase Der n=1 Tax=Thermorudis peleae TaxID=1382356 RepID=UPI00068B9318|nr:ribosome biogenesis GTPase Der [Thermorudis peleae]